MAVKDVSRALVAAWNGMSWLSAICLVCIGLEWGS